MSDHHDPDITQEFWGPESRQRVNWHSVQVSPFVKRLVVLGLVGILMAPVAVALRSPQSPTPITYAQSGQERGPGIDSQVVIVTTTPADSADSEGPRTPATPETAPASGGVQMMSVPILNTPEELRSLQQQELCPRTYRVHSGDSWLRIAASGQIPIAQLLRVNEASMDTTIHPGQDLCIPSGARMPSPPPVTTVSNASSSGGRGSVTPAPRPAPAPTAASRPTPAPTPTPAVAPTGPRPSTDQVIAMIREIWPEELQERAIAIAHRESRYQADAYNGWCCYGVFQIYWNVHRSWLGAHGVRSASQLLDARTNIQMAYQIYQRAGGWRPWT